MEPKKESLGELTILGNVQIVLDGSAEEKNLHSLSEFAFLYALGAGTFSEKEKIGECLVLQKRAHVCWVENGKEISEGSDMVHAPFLMGIDQRQKAAEIFSYDSVSPMSVSALYEKYAEKYPLGCAIIGLSLVKALQATYLKKAPIYFKNVNANHSEYWADASADPMKIIGFFGVFISPSARKRYPEKILGRAFYKNPTETMASPIESHTHAAILSLKEIHPVHNLDEMGRVFKQSPVQGVRHLLTSTEIIKGSFALFPFDQIRVI